MRSKTIYSARLSRRRQFRPTLETLERRELLTGSAFWDGLAGNSQHTGISPVASQPLDTIRWQTPVDLNPQFSFGELLIHYGEIMITNANTVIVPVKVGATDGFRLDAHNGRDGSMVWSQSTDYILPTHDWTPSFPAVLTPSGRVYFAGPGGTVYFRDNVNSPNGATGQIAFFGPLSTYLANRSAYDSTVFIDTPLTSDSHGDIFFGFRVEGFSPLSIGSQSGYARIDPNGNGTFIGVTDATGDPRITRDSHNVAPVLSNDESTIYVEAKDTFVYSYAYLIALNSTTLATEHQVLLHDPRDNNANTTGTLDNGSASPVVAPDGSVFFGVFGNPDNGSRGFTLHFSADLSTEMTPGAFGWDDTISIVPASMVPSYTGTSSYLIFTKYNNYAGADDGDGVNRIAILDPNATMVDPHPSSDGLLVMNVVESIVGPTPDPNFRPFFPNAVREWCINTAAVDPGTDSVLCNSEDGNLYRWDLRTDTLSESMTLGPALGQAYTPTAIGPDGTVYSINDAKLFAVGRFLSSIKVEALPPSTIFGQPVTLNASVRGSGPSPLAGTVQFFDGSTALGAAPIDSAGHALLVVSDFGVGTHSISAFYSGDATHLDARTLSAASAIVAMDSSDVVLKSSTASSVFSAFVIITAAVTGHTTGLAVTSGTVTFFDGTTNIGSVFVDSSGHAQLFTSSLGVGTHSITASFSGNVDYTASTSTALSLPIVADRTTTGLSASPNPSSVGQSVTLTATVIANFPGFGIPTGTVTFRTSAGILGTATLDGTGHVSITIATLPAGSVTISAVYAGDGNFLASTGSTLQQVNRLPVSERLTSSANPSTAGQTVTFTAVVSSASGTPTGSVTFLDRGTVLGVVPLDSSGTATLSTSALTVGSHKITAVYGGSSVFSGTSAALAQVVNPTAGVISHASAANSVSFSSLRSNVRDGANTSPPRGNGRPIVSDSAMSPRSKEVVGVLDADIVDRIFGSL